MKKNVASFALTLAVSAAGLSSLASTASADYWCDTTIKEVIQWRTGDVSIVGNAFSNNGTSVWACVRATDGAVCDAMLSIAEAAQLSGRTVRVKVSGAPPASNPCTTLPSKLASGAAPILNINLL